MRTWIPLLLAVCLFAAPRFAGAAAAGDSGQVERLLAPGRQEARQGRFAAALRKTEEALAEADGVLPQDHWGRAYLLNDLARWNSELGQRTEALVFAQDALAIASEAFRDDPVRIAYFSQDVGALRFSLGDCQGAESVLKSTMESLPASAMRQQVGLNYARLQWSMGNLPLAHDAAARVLGDSSDGGASLLLAKLEMDQGALAAARRRLDAYRISAGLTPDRAQWPGDYMDAELSYSIRVIDVRTARALAEQLEASAESSTPERMGATAHRLGQVAFLAGRFPDAERYLNEAIQQLAGTGGGVSPVAATAYHDLALVYRLTGDYPRSTFYFDKALASARSCSSAADPMPVLMLRERSLLRLEQGNTDAALADIDEATRRLQSVQGEQRILAGLLAGSRSLVLARLQRYEDSEKEMERANALTRDAEGADSYNLVLGYVHLADLAYRKSDLARAQREATLALRILDAHGSESIWGAATALGIRAAASARTGNADAYWRDASRFAEIVERSLTSDTGVTSVTKSEVTAARIQAERMLDALPSSEPAHRSLIARLMQLPHLSDATSAIQATALSSADLPANVRDLVQKRAELIELSQARRGALFMAQQRGESIDQSTISELGRLQRDLSQVEELLSRLDPAVAGQLIQRLVAADTVRQHLRPREFLYLQVVTDSQVHGLLLGKDAMEYRNSRYSRVELRSDVSTLRRALDLAYQSSDRIPFDTERANRLYRNSLGAFDGFLHSGDELVVIADDAFQSVPWAVLVTNVEQGAGDDEFLIDRLALSSVPSLQSFVALRRSPRLQHASRSFMAFADPSMESFRPGSTGLHIDREEAEYEVVRHLKPLNDARLEAEQMARDLNAGADVVFSREAATEQRVREAPLASFRFLSFSTHGVMAGEVPGRPEAALLLTRKRFDDPDDDGFLTASEVSRLRLQADLVILSACNTGRINPRAGITGISGLARGFFAAGSRSLLVSHWSVHARASALLLTDAIQRMAANPGLGKAEALRQSMIAMRTAQLGERYTGPEYWGAFTVVGDSGA